MESEATVLLAADVLRDHFGGAAERVGLVLLQRGTMPLQEVMRFVNQAKSSFEVVEPMRFAQVRNALLSLIQHGVVAAKPHPQVGSGGALAVVPQVYSIDVDEVLSRLRLPHFLEHVRWMHGDLAYSLVYQVLRYGRVSAGVAVQEARKALRNATEEELRAELQMLISHGLLAPVAPNVSAMLENDATQPRQPASASASGAEEAAAAALKRPRMESKLETMVVAYSRAQVNLALCKNLVMRLIEERVNQYAAQVAGALLSAVTLGNEGRVTVEFLNLAQVESRMREMGTWAMAQDPEKQREKIRRCLEALTAHSDSLVRRRVVQVVAAGPAAGGMAEEQQWSALWEKAKRSLVKFIKAQLIRDEFGQPGHRMFNFLVAKSPPQKYEDKDIFDACMVSPQEGREILNNMVRSHFVHWQEVPKGGANPQPYSSFWLYYVDIPRAEAAMTQNAMQAMLNLRVRFRVESKRTAPLETRVKSLTPMERIKLQNGRRCEDILERSFLVLDSVLLVMRHFG